MKKTVIVTGGTSGYGFAIAKKFQNAGYTVLITGRDAQRLQTAPKACGGGSLERYHFKDAGWIDCRALEKVESSPYAEKIKKNIAKLCLNHKNQ